MRHFRFFATNGTARKIIAGLFFAGMGSSALATPILYTFTGVVVGNSDPVNPAGTVQAFTYLSTSGFVSSTQGVPLANLISCTGCSSDYGSPPAAPGDYPVTFLPAFGGYDYIDFLNYNSTTLSDEFYYFGLGAFSTVGTFVLNNGPQANAGTLTVGAVPEPRTMFLVAASLTIFWRYRRVLRVPRVAKDRCC
jgi:hypothetical protein